MLATFACVREPLPEICPDLAAGDLVITELHGLVGSDPEWIEIANRSTRTIDLFGLHVILQNLSGTEGVRGIVRYSPPPLPPGGYFVLGIVPDVDLPDIIDYGLQGNHVNEATVPTAESESGTDAVAQENDNDPVVKMPIAGVIKLEACDVLIDKAVYPELPELGTRSLGGVPDADANDDDAAWCTDDFVPDGAMTGLGARGTPGEANRPCE